MYVLKGDGTGTYNRPGPFNILEESKEDICIGWDNIRPDHWLYFDPMFRSTDVY